MAQKPGRIATAERPAENVVDVDVSHEMQASFLEYAYSVIYARALPDARDGLKPVQRRILFQMAQMGLRSDRGHVKSARVVGEVMGRLHPHGDSAIYDALVRMAQPFSLRLPLIDGHGNFGSADDGPAAMRYTECRLAPAADVVTASLDEDVVDFVGNYDGREREPVVLPAAVPLLLVNGAAGIAVGMATNIPPHNLREVCAAAIHLLQHPRATLDDLMGFVPGPDLPSGGQIHGLEGVRDAYATGRGTFKMRATTRIEQVSPRRRGIVVTALPYGVGPEKVIDRIKQLVLAKKINGIADLTDLTDGEHGLHLVIEVKSGFSPEAVRDNLFRLTPLEESFSSNCVALVDGQPRTLGLREFLSVFLEHRIEVVRRRSQYRLAKAQTRLHLVDGLLIATLNIDEVIAVIRSSDDAAAARQRLIAIFDLSDEQATHILDMPLRRLTKFSRLELESEKANLEQTIAELSEILGNEKSLKRVVAQELQAAAKAHGTARRTVLLDGEVAVATQSAPLEMSDEPCQVILTTRGLLARTAGTTNAEAAGGAAICASAPATTRGTVAVVTSRGLAYRVNVEELPMASSGHSVAGAPVSEYCQLGRSERPVGLMTLLADSASVDDAGGPVALVTSAGTVKRLAAAAAPNKDSWEVITLKPGDSVVAAMAAPDGSDLFIITTDAQLLRFPAAAVRPQGRSASGMAGIRLSHDARVVGFATLKGDPDLEDTARVVTVAGDSSRLEGTSATSIKISRADAFPRKGRGTAGVRCHRFTRGEDILIAAWAGTAEPVVETASGQTAPLTGDVRDRDATGTALTTTTVAAVGASAVTALVPGDDET